MGFLVTTLIFFVAGVVAALSVRLCFNGGPSINLLRFTLVVTATVCCWMMTNIFRSFLDAWKCYRNMARSAYNFNARYRLWAIVYLAQLKPLIVPILSEGE